MNYNVLLLPFFGRQLKRLIKKYPSLRKECASLIDRLETEPDEGVSIGDDCYKIRLAVASKSKGKSGGARVITLIVHKSVKVYLLSIYDKSEQEDIGDKELKALIKAANEL